jgi:hypothetical protein
MCLTIGFSDMNKNDGVMCRISELRDKPEILNLHRRIQSKQQDCWFNETAGPMKQRWVSYAISPNR